LLQETKKKGKISFRHCFSSELKRKFIYEKKKKYKNKKNTTENITKEKNQIIITKNKCVRIIFY